MASSVSAAYRRRADAMEDAPRRAVKAGAKTLTRSITKEARRDTGGDLRLSGIPSARLGLKTTLSGSSRSAIAEVEANPRKARGPWSWLESGTRAHSVRARRRGGRSGRGDRLAMRIGDDWARGPWTVRGVRAKGTFSRGVEDVRDEVLDEVRTIVRSALL